VDAVIPANSDVALPSAVNLINTVGTLPIVAIQPFQASNPSGVWIWFFLFHMPLSSCRGLWRLWIPMGSGVRRLGQGSPPPTGHVWPNMCWSRRGWWSRSTARAPLRVRSFFGRGRPTERSPAARCSRERHDVEPLGGD
jgi:hypothetical protein